TDTGKHAPARMKTANRAVATAVCHESVGVARHRCLRFGTVFAAASTTEVVPGPGYLLIYGRAPAATSKIKRAAPPTGGARAAARVSGGGLTPNGRARLRRAADSLWESFSAIR